MKLSLRFMDWPIRAKMAALFVIISLLPLGVATWINIRETKQRMLATTETLLGARGDQLEQRLDAFHFGYQRSVGRIAHLPEVGEFCLAGPEGRERLKEQVRKVLDIWVNSDPQIRGIAILDMSGTVRFGTEKPLVGVDLSHRKYVQDALRGSAVISDIHLAASEVGGVPTVAYLSPVYGPDQRQIGIANISVRAAAFWGVMKSSNELAGATSFAAVFDHQGIRVGHTFSDEIVFHPGGRLDPAAVDLIVAENRYGASTRKILEDVRDYPTGFAMALSESPDGRMFREIAPVNHKWSYAVARRLKTVPWTVFYILPQESLDAPIAQMSRQKIVFGGVIALIALLSGTLVAAVVLRPIHSLTRATELIAADDLTARVPAAYFDELGRLGSSFNSMAARIETQAGALRRSHRDMEVRVQERTAQLLKTTGELEAEVAERKQAEETARNSEAQLQTIVQSLDEGVVVSDLDGRIVHFNRAAVELHGFSKPEEYLIHLAQFADIFELAGMDGAPWPVDQWPLARVLRGEKLRCLDVRIRKNHADWSRIFSYGGTLVHDPAGNPLMAILTIADVTERKRSEATARQLAAIVESSSDAIISKDLDSVVTSWNDSAERMFGFTAQEMVGRSVTTIIPPAYQQDEQKIIARIKRGERVGHFETERLHKDGGTVAVSVTVSPIFDAQGNVIGASKVAHDDTERKQAAAEIHRLNAELEQRVEERTAQLQTVNAELEAFSYSVSHDLRAPLRSLDGFSLALMEDCADKLNAEDMDNLRRIRAASQRMGQLIDDLLNLSRISRIDMVRQPCDLSKLAQTVAEELRVGDPARQVSVAIAPELTVEGDPRLLRIALTNLFSNAWKFTSKRPDACIELGCAGENGHRTFFVRDNGVGFDMAHVDKLFGAFQRLHAMHEFPGTGIGLVTVQRIIRRHGGRIWAQSTPDVGATFNFTL